MTRSSSKGVVELVIVVSAFHLVVSLCVLYFKLTGRLTDGPMFFDLETPTYGALLLFQSVCVAILAACFFTRAKLLRKTGKT
jgi:hypothetical protein